ncbi:MAG: glutamate-5-semialdehyde dehydrogenase [Bacteroidales bacterium]|jgi:glutamate-5-semialdehyde dehydrogenase|nr:glutamate-5-semialdehyde dehydrogenase [Bacteroidales bacterium]
MNCNKQFEAIKKASRTLLLLSDEQINSTLSALADAAVANTDFILSENAKDLARMDKEDPKYDRLLLSKERIADIASDIRNIAQLPSPLGKELMEIDRPNGMNIQKISVPFGVIGVIYESRPNVSFDVFSLCLKSGNTCVLKGGSDAANSNAAIVKVIKETLENENINTDIVQLLPPDRSATAELLNAHGYVDLLIPRGSQGLINYVRENAKIPVIETGAGICHTYFDASGDVTKGKAIINNAKTRRPSVCNSLDCLVLHQDRLADLPQLCELLPEFRVEIFADEAAYAALDGYYPAELLKQADENSFGTEFLSFKMAIKTVASFDEALDHVSQYSSKHSECIVAEDQDTTQTFLKLTDAAAVYANVSTAFTDGAEFGLGAEIGISTQKLHARGPMALEELTSYKWVITGDGIIRK